MYFGFPIAIDAIALSDGIGGNMLQLFALNHDYKIDHDLFTLKLS
jgi:hypothetical protein